MKHLATILLAVVASLLAVYAFGPKGGAGVAASRETAYERVMRTGVLRCGYNTWPPAVEVDANTGKVGGIVPELVEYAANAMSLKVEWVQQASWGTFTQDLKDGRFDAMCAGAWETKEAAPYVTYTEPVFFNPVYPYVRSNDHRFDIDLKVLNSPNYRIATIDGAMTDIIAKEDFPRAKRVSLPQMADNSEAVLNVANGKADVVFNEASVMLQFDASNPGVLRPLGNAPYRSFASPLLAAYITDAALVRMFDTVLSEMQLQGTTQRIIDKYSTDRRLFVPVAKPYGEIE
ncbi:MAG: transporter substrate-binding domain-containing protein [Pseudomonadaceae bacterium]|nr:transporter substrate-binding domain-containing protein [Pseudomonadaceae bacterium]